MRKTGSGENSKLPEKIEPKFWTLDEVAAMLRLSVSSFTTLRQHPFYAPDSSRLLKKGRGTKALPLWSSELVELFKDVRKEAMPGVRLFSDDEGLKIRNGMMAKLRERYIALAE